MMKRISVQDIMTRKVIGVDKETFLSEIINLMSNKKIGSIVILDGETPIGIITIRQILQLAEKCTPPTTTRANAVMSTPLVKVKPKFNLRNASILMLQKGIKKLVVVENGKLAGLVTTTDIERVFMPFDSPFDVLKNKTSTGLALREEFQTDLALKRVEDIMSTDVKTVNESMMINQIAKIMNKTKIGSLIVTKDDIPVGIVTDIDILSKIMDKGLDPCETTAKEGMQKLVNISPKASLNKAIETMIETTVRKLGVINTDGTLIGIITTTDFLVYYRSLLFSQKMLNK
jgi:CBS domain-containing protein